MAGVYLSWKIGTFVSSMAQSAVATYTAMAATMAAKDAVVQKAAADAAATASSASLTAARVIELQVAVLAAEGETALAITTNGLVPAQARAAAAAAAHAAAQSALAVAEAEASIATGALNTALSFMGGPIGILITLIGAAATAWALFGDHGKSAVQGINDEVAKGIAIAERYNKEMKFGTGDAGQLTASLDAVNQRISLLSQSKGQGAADQLRLARAEAEKLEAALMQAGKAASSVAPASGSTDSQKAAAAVAAAAAAAFLATSQGRDDPARIRLQSQIKEGDAEIVQIKANQTYVEKLLQDSYAQQYLDANTYFADRRIVIQSALADEVAQYAKESADVAIYLASSKDKDKVERAAAANLLIGEKLTKAQNEAGRELAATVTDQNNIYREFELTTNAVAHAQQLANDQSAFELDMIGRTTSQVAQLTAARLIQLAVDERIYQARLKNIPTGLRDQADFAAQAAADKAVADAKAKHDQNLSYNFNLGTTDVSHTSKLADDAARFSLELMGKTTLAVAQQNAAKQIQLALDARLYELEKLREKLSPEDLAKAVLDAEMQKAAAIARVTDEYERQRTAQFGISEAFRKYSEEAGNTAAHMEALFTKSFKGMEDALVSFVRTGKLDFASLANSIVDDLIRIAIQASITGPLAAAMKSGGAATFFASIFGFADGGEPPMGRASLVGENGLFLTARERSFPTLPWAVGEPWSMSLSHPATGARSTAAPLAVWTTLKSLLRRSKTPWPVTSPAAWALCPMPWPRPMV
jgi:phage-related minor tail protein